MALGFLIYLKHASGGFLDNRGSDINDSIGLLCAQVKILAFLCGKKQLSVTEVVKTRNVANVRIHVKGLIGALRQKHNF